MQTWVIKLSKLCNMRCSYCYEWNELSNPARMSLECWRRTLQAAIDYHRRLVAKGRARSSSTVLIILHGGEPFALPTRYLREILTVYEEMSSQAPEALCMALQSNLYSVSDEKIELMREHGVHISFSYDVIPGVRLNVLGKPTEATVLRNIQRLRRMGINLGGIAVLAKHTVDHVTDVYDFYAQNGMGMRILPLFGGPDERPAEQFAVDHPTVIAALERLFRHWMETGCKVHIRPFDLYFQTALRHMGGYRVGQYRRKIHGDGVLLINVDGGVFRVVDAYEPELSMGNVAEQSIDEVLASDAYAASLARDEEEYAQHCAGCSYRSACNAGFIYDTRPASTYGGACVTAWHCIEFMVRFIREQGYGEEDIRSLALAVRGSGQGAHPSVSV